MSCMFFITLSSDIRGKICLLKLHSHMGGEYRRLASSSVEILIYRQIVHLRAIDCDLMWWNLL